MYRESYLIEAPGWTNFDSIFVLLPCFLQIVSKFLFFYTAKVKDMINVYEKESKLSVLFYSAAMFFPLFRVFYILFTPTLVFLLPRIYLH